ncbi:hypothetical protein BBD42_05600 [Paenibacillus sp. BIHB 4019]|uniref:SLH domain-containing protein n=1 Tax=Paenibacillus sp. BIHB 4019 TaxID=1870819 RepID=A0A1B2DE52_9BACL|nr:S-layer homology domain-containing protein [Paenibacillus sp. BIHB 4019]ANY65992.1 hypothetical protein BBD42_05600 [Paenibacillus sp. BIHB 4019]
MKLGKLSLLICLLLCVASTTLFAASAKSSADFTDLKDLDAATKAKFDALISAGVFDGVSEGTFGLKEEMNRAQFAKVAALVFDLKVDSGLKTSSFNDVGSDSASYGYALPYIEAIKKAGITDGVGQGSFEPAGKVTKEQLATFLIRGLGKQEEAEQTPGVEDNSVSDWAKGYVAYALSNKLVTISADGTFGGKSNATREMLAITSYEVAVQTGVVDVVIPSPTPTPTPSSTSASSSTYSPAATPTPEPTATPTPEQSATPTSEPTPPIVEPTPPIVEPTPPIVVPTPPIVVPTPPIVVPTPPIVVPTPPIIIPTPPIVVPTPPIIIPTPPNPTEIP